ncbi:hypothetical protein LOKG_00054 [Loktanella phage pCB2051-A]|uniref:Uncharacterized protein n=1 Tax=Loktanella phage pCB2051-A TaxID=754044 RepID=M4QPD8_9CAUD|nr:hypothetical protein LOKG_00054 [Loktanella phage pCB2051-A]AGH31490.1 hypothetical protein LOKG_00054 [Loktanella phage pCB2051-A]
MSDKMNVEGFEGLGRVLMAAYDQSARGKGKERHGHTEPFATQPIMMIPQMVGLGGLTYQIMKKAQEATTMSARDRHEAAIAELKGVIVYAAAAVLHVERLAKKADEDLETDEEARDRELENTVVMKIDTKDWSAEDMERIRKMSMGGMFQRGPFMSEAEAKAAYEGVAWAGEPEPYEVTKPLSREEKLVEMGVDIDPETEMPMVETPATFVYEYPYPEDTDMFQHPARSFMGGIERIAARLTEGLKPAGYATGGFVNDVPSKPVPLIYGTHRLGGRKEPSYHETGE